MRCYSTGLQMSCVQKLIGSWVQGVKAQGLGDWVVPCKELSLFLCKEITPCRGSTYQCVLLEQEGIAVAKHTDEGKQYSQSQVRPKYNMETPGFQLTFFFFFL